MTTENDGRFVLQNLHGSIENLEIPPVRTLAFANDLVSSVYDAFERNYSKTRDYWQYEDRKVNALGMNMTFRVRMCGCCNRPLLRGHAWVFSVDQYGNAICYDAAKKKLTGTCCEMGMHYDNIREEFVRRNLRVVLESLRSNMPKEGKSVRQIRRKADDEWDV